MYLGVYAGITGSSALLVWFLVKPNVLPSETTNDLWYLMKLRTNQEWMSKLQRHILLAMTFLHVNPRICFEYWALLDSLNLGTHQIKLYELHFDTVRPIVRSFIPVSLSEWPWALYLYQESIDWIASSEHARRHWTVIAVQLKASGNQRRLKC